MVASLFTPNTSRPAVVARRAAARAGLRAEAAPRAGRVTSDLSAYEGERILELVEEARGHELLYPPFYSPDLNPTGKTLGKTKIVLRKAQVRNREGLIEAAGREGARCDYAPGRERLLRAPLIFITGQLS